MERQPATAAPWPVVWLAAFAVALVLRLSIDLWGPTAVDLAWARYGSFDESAARPAPEVVKIGGAQSLVIAGDRRYAVDVFQIPIILIQTARQLPPDLTGPWAGFGVLYFLFTSTLGIGVTQLFYLAPLMLLLSLITWRATLKGVCIAGLVTTLANIWFMLRIAIPSPGSYADY